MSLWLSDAGRSAEQNLWLEIGCRPDLLSTFLPGWLCGCLGRLVIWFDNQAEGPEKIQRKPAGCQPRSDHSPASLEKPGELIRSICDTFQHLPVSIFNYMAPTVSLGTLSEVYESPAA